MRFRLRIRTTLILIALVAIVIGAGLGFERRRTYCLTRAREHESAFRSYQLVLAVENEFSGTTWASPKPPDVRLHREYESLAARHQEAARGYGAAATNLWAPIPASPPDLPKHRGFLFIP